MVPDFPDNIINWIRDNPDILTAWVTLLTAVAAFIYFLWTRISRLLSAVVDRYLQRLRVHIISSKSYKKLDDFLELFHSSFSPDERIATSEINDWIQFKSVETGIQYNLFLCYYGKLPVGLAITFFDKDLGLLYIPYLAVSKIDSEWKNTRNIVQAILKCIDQVADKWKIALAEVSDPDEPNLSREEARRRMARVRRLRDLSSRAGLSMKRIDLPYIEPAFMNDIELSEDRSMVLYTLLKSDLLEMKRSDVISSLSFMTRVYNASYCGTSEACDLYEKALLQRLKNWGQSLPERVNLVS